MTKKQGKADTPVPYDNYLSIFSRNQKKWLLSTFHILGARIGAVNADLVSTRRNFNLL